MTKTIDQWFDISAFRRPAAGFLGTSWRGVLRAPGVNNWDTGLFKNFATTEKVSFQFRFESFSAFNHTRWGVHVRNVADVNFGKITSARDARINQIGAKIIFFVTARHCLQSLWKIGTVGKKQQKTVVEGLAARFADCEAEKNCTLIRYDIIQGVRKLYDAIGDEKVREKALELIETEQDLKYRKKYAGLWKTK